MPTVADLTAAMESIAPLSTAEEWDRVGLHVGLPERELAGPVYLTIDLTEPVVVEAVEAGASAIVSYHPPIWQPLTRLTERTPAERVVRRAIEHRIAIYSPHTALDAAAGGVTDWLCEGIAGLSDGESGLSQLAGDCRALIPAPAPASEDAKLVVFVPADHIEKVRNALATAGAGVIGNYRVCSFSQPGEGTFLPGDEANPAVGARGQLERVAEHRMEMVCTRSSLPLAIETLRQFHPYEEPAFDVYELAPVPQRTVGAGRKLVLDRPLTMAQAGRRLAEMLGRARMKYALPHGASDTPVHRFAVVPGAGAAMIDEAAAQGCEAFVTGEMKHHDVLAAQALGLRVLLAGHTNTERGYLPRLASALQMRLPHISIEISRADADPLRVLDQSSGG